MTTQHGQARGRSATPTTTKKAANVGAAAQLAALISKLQAQRQQHEDAIANIDATFEQFGIAAAPAKKRPSRPHKAAKKAKKGKRTRRTFEVNGQDSILGFIKAAGKKGVTTSEVVKHWRSEGRLGDGYTSLSQLVTAKKLKKEKIKGEKGSRYTAA